MRGLVAAPRPARCSASSATASAKLAALADRAGRGSAWHRCPARRRVSYRRPPRQAAGPARARAAWPPSSRQAHPLGLEATEAPRRGTTSASRRAFNATAASSCRRVVSDSARVASAKLLAPRLREPAIHARRRRRPRSSRHRAATPTQAADRRRQLLVHSRPAGLALQAVELLGQLADDIVEPGGDCPRRP